MASFEPSKPFFRRMPHPTDSLPHAQTSDTGIPENMCSAKARRRAYSTTHCCVSDLRHFQASFVQAASLVSSVDHAVEEEIEDIAVLEILVREHPPGVAQRGHSESPGGRNSPAQHNATEQDRTAGERMGRAVFPWSLLWLVTVYQLSIRACSACAKNVEAGAAAAADGVGRDYLCYDPGCSLSRGIKRTSYFVFTGDAPVATATMLQSKQNCALLRTRNHLER